MHEVFLIKWSIHFHYHLLNVFNVRMHFQPPGRVGIPSWIVLACFLHFLARIQTGLPWCLLSLTSSPAKVRTLHVFEKVSSWAGELSLRKVLPEQITLWPTLELGKLCEDYQISERDCQYWQLVWRDNMHSFPSTWLDELQWLAEIPIFYATVL